MKETKAYCDVCGTEVENLRENFIMIYEAPPNNVKESREFHICFGDLKKRSILDIIEELRKNKKLKPQPGMILQEIKVDTIVMGMKWEKVQGK